MPVNITAEMPSSLTVGTVVFKMKINYLKPFTGGEIIAEAEIVHKGTMTAIGDVDVRDGKGNLIAKGLATYAIFKKENHF